MAVDFNLPNLGENIDAGDVTNVMVKEGDTIAANQPVVEVETGKATVEIPCPHAGRITKVHVKAGQSVKVGGPLISIEAAAGAAAAPPAKAPAAPAAAPAPAAARPATPAPTPAPSAAPQPVAHEPVSASNGGPARKPAPVAEPEPVGASSVAAAAGPSTRRLARELGVDIDRVRGTGPGGRITRDDIVAAVRSAASHAPSLLSGKASNLPEGVEETDRWGTIVKAPLSRIRKTIAANMVYSSQSIPHVTNFDEADITELERIRKSSLDDYARQGIKLTMMPFVMKAVAQALRQKDHALMNAALDMENEQLVYKDYVNLGVAVDTERGLVVPVMRSVDRMTIPQIGLALQEMAEKARTFKFAPDDQIGGTFTISNMGAVGGVYSTPIINPPQVAILLTGRSRKLPVVMEDDSIRPRLMMPLSLSYDHRVVDGAAAARFLNEVKNYLQVPGRLLLAQ